LDFINWLQRAVTNDPEKNLARCRVSLIFACDCCNQPHTIIAVRWTMLRILMFAGMVLGAGLLAANYADQVARAPANASPVQAVNVAPVNSRTMVLKANDGGHFETDARVDGRRIAFMVDTGASQIALRESEAARLGFHPTPRDYSIKIGTANGTIHAALIQLGMVEVGNIIVRDLPAVIIPDESLGVNLLGMSFLSRVRWSHERGKLIIEQ
jgi:aspartyl protease family protein